jgi:hypothetical protein
MKKVVLFEELLGKGGYLLHGPANKKGLGVIKFVGVGGG